MRSALKCIEIMILDFPAMLHCIVLPLLTLSLLPQPHPITAAFSSPWLMLLMLQNGGKVLGKEGELVDLQDSPLAGNVRIFTDYDPECVHRNVCQQ